MPCPYFNIKKLTRKMKSHVVDRAAYLAGERLREERTSETSNHTDKDDPGNMPTAARCGTPSTRWRAGKTRG